MNKVLAILICGLSCLPFALAAQGSGAIRGRVLDTSGKPVAGAIVYAAAQNGFSYLPRGRSDARGYYSIEKLTWGSYWLYTSKEQNGFPSTGNAFYTGWNRENQTQASVTAAQPVAVVDVKLGRKAGWLVGSVKDAETGWAVESVCSKLQWESDASIWTTGATGGIFRQLIPADTRVGLKVWAWGYKPWNDTALQVKAGEKRKIDVRLIPLKPKRNPTEKELLAMKESMARTGCSLPEPNEQP
jgi:hypothetical protein